jgi:hypothetical protein
VPRISSPRQLALVAPCLKLSGSYALLGRPSKVMERPSESSSRATVASVMAATGEFGTST